MQKQLQQALQELEGKTLVVNIGAKGLKTSALIENFGITTDDTNFSFGDSKKEAWDFRISKCDIGNVRLEPEHNILNFYVGEVHLDFTI